MPCSAMAWAWWQVAQGEPPLLDVDARVEGHGEGEGQVEGEGQGEGEGEGGRLDACVATTAIRGRLVYT